MDPNAQITDSNLMGVLTHTIESLVTSGQHLKIDEKKMKEVKKICR